MKMRFINGRFAVIPQANTIPKEITLVASPRKNKDIRITLAYSLFESFETGNVLIYGAPRSGKTTAFIAESIDRLEKFICLEPTRKIATETVSEACKKADYNYGIPVNILGNKDGCIKIQEAIMEFPMLEKLPTIPLPKLCYDCDQCDECRLRQILKMSDDEISGISLTYHKLVSLMLSDNPVNKDILDKICRLPKNVILDECHKLETEEVKRINLLKHSNESTEVYNFNQYNFIQGGKTAKMIEQFKEIVNCKEIKTATSKILEKALSKNYYDESLRCIIKNPVYNPSVAARKQMFTGVYHEAVEFVKMLYKHEVKFTINDINQLYNIIAIVTAPKIQVCAIHDHGNVYVQIAAVNTIFRTMIRSFIKSMESKRRIILASGTINNTFDYNQLFLTNVNYVKWGSNGDPLKTCNKMHVYADHKRCTLIDGRKEYSIMGDIDGIVSDIIKIRNVYPDAKIVTMNRDIANMIHKKLSEVGKPGIDVDFYNSKRSIGVACDSRAMITVGLAYKPANTFDVVTDDAEDSYIMLHESIHADTYQAINRVKDPEGKKDSFVFMLRSNLSDVEKVLTWGINRRVRTDLTKSGKTTKITYSDQISSPSVEKCKNVDEMLRKASCHK